MEKIVKDLKMFRLCLRRERQEMQNVMFLKQSSSRLSSELECKNVYLTAFMSACVFVVCACRLDCVYMSKFACYPAGWMGLCAGSRWKVLVVDPNAHRAWDS